MSESKILKDYKCPKCGKEKWTWVLDSMEQYCECGFTRAKDESEFEENVGTKDKNKGIEI